MKNQERLSFSAVAVQLLKEKPQTHLHTLAPIYARRTKVSREEAQMLILAFVAVLNNKRESVALEERILIKEALKYLRLHRGDSKEADVAVLLLTPECPICGGKLEECSWPTDKDYDRWGKFIRFGKGDYYCADCNKLVETFQELRLELPQRPTDFQYLAKSPEEMTWGELSHYVAEIRREGYDATRYLVDLETKIAFPCTSLVMALLGIGVALYQGKRGGMPRGSR